VHSFGSLSCRRNRRDRPPSAAAIARRIYNIAEADGTVSSEKARRELGFKPDFRLKPA
jgi:hypothetical protein